MQQQQPSSRQHTTAIHRKSKKHFLACYIHTNSIWWRIDAVIVMMFFSFVFFLLLLLLLFFCHISHTIYWCIWMFLARHIFHSTHLLRIRRIRVCLNWWMISHPFAGRKLIWFGSKKSNTNRLTVLELIISSRIFDFIAHNWHSFVSTRNWFELFH